MTKTLCLMLAGALALALPALSDPRPRLVWNASPSAPIGLYRVTPNGQTAIGALVLARPPAPLARLFAARGYLPLGVPLVKPVAAGPGQLVCRRDRIVTVDGRVAGHALARDRRGRRLPIWRGCRRLSSGEVFLLSEGVRDALDGRYFGPLAASSTIGRAIPVWTEQAR